MLVTQLTKLQWEPLYPVSESKSLASSHTADVFCSSFVYCFIDHVLNILSYLILAAL